MKGKIKWYDEVKGFGFIEQENGKDIFVHRTGLENAYANIDEGDEVEFETKETPRGLAAIDVKRVS